MAQKESRPRHEVRLPGFSAATSVGLGDVVKRGTARVGVRPCGGCQRRAAALNRWMSFTGRARGPQ